MILQALGISPQEAQERANRLSQQLAKIDDTLVEESEQEEGVEDAEMQIIDFD